MHKRILILLSKPEFAQEMRLLMHVPTPDTAWYHSAQV